MTESADAVFARLERGELSPATAPALSDGWEATLPDGRTVRRSTLQHEARPLIEQGAAAVPALLRWADHRNAAVRYVAVYALEEITGERPYVPRFDDEDRDGDRARAIAVWRAWYDAHR